MLFRSKNIEDKIKEAIADKSKWKTVINELLTTDVLVVAQPGPANMLDANGQRQLNILTFNDPKLGTVVPFFTSPQRVSVLVTKEHLQFNCIKIKTINFFNAIKGKQAIMNPNSDCGKVFTPFEMNVLVMENKHLIPQRQEVVPPVETTDRKSVV